MKKLVFLLLFTPLLASAQRQEIDSLLKVLNQINKISNPLIRDTSSVTTIQYLMYHYTFVDTDSALLFTNRLLDIAKKRNLSKKVVYCHNYFGYLYNQSGNYFLGANNYYQALILAEKLKDSVQILQSKRLLTESYIHLEDYDKAFQYAKESLSLAKIRKDQNEELSSMASLGDIYIKEGKPTEAKKVFSEMNLKALKIGDRDFIPLSIKGLANVAFKLKNYDEAIGLFKKEMTYYEPFSNLFAKAQVDLSKALIAKHQYNEATTLLLKAEKIALKEKGEGILPNTYQLLYESYKAQKNLPKALYFHEKFMVLKDSLSKESIQKRINSLQLEYDNTLKESQLQKKNIELLEEKNQTQQLTQTRNLFIGGGLLAIIIACVLFWNNKKLNLKNRQIELQKNQILLAQEQLENANQTLEFRVNERTKALEKANEEIKTAVFTGQTIERKRVASELHDNLSSLLSAIKMSLQVIKTDKLTESEKQIYSNIREMMGNAYSEVRNISHNIMPEGLERDGLYKILGKLVEKLNQNQQLSFRLISKNMEIRPPISIELNVYSIILELLNNIIKHSEATEASIELIKEVDFLIINVNDNGKGINTAKSGDGAGLGNIKARLEAMNGNISIQSIPRKKTVFEIKIPIIP